MAHLVSQYLHLRLQPLKRIKTASCPVFGMIEPEEIVDFMKENVMNDVNMQIQLHKIIWSPDKKGV